MLSLATSRASCFCYHGVGAAVSPTKASRVATIVGKWTFVHDIHGLASFCSSGPEVATTVDVHAAKDLIGSGHWYLDVRTQEEFKAGHVDVEKVSNIPYLFITPQGRVKNPGFLEQVSSACSKDDPIIVGCQSGVRSLSATTDLLNAGFKHARNMGGGYVKWVEHGFAVKKPHP